MVLSLTVECKHAFLNKQKEKFEVVAVLLIKHYAMETWGVEV
jgi:hypothetical protein